MTEMLKDSYDGVNGQPRRKDARLNLTAAVNNKKKVILVLNEIFNSFLHLSGLNMYLSQIVTVLDIVANDRGSLLSKTT